MRHRLAALAAVLLVGLPAGLGADPPAASPSFPLWPIPREARVADTRLLLTDATIVVPPGDPRAQYPGRLLAELVADHFGVAIPVAVGAAPQGRTPIVVGEASAEIVAAAVRRAGAGTPDAAEGYLLSVDAAGAVVAGRDYRGALYGVSSFVQLVHRWGKQSVAVRQAVVRDWPFLPLRWVHLYLPGRDQLGFARRYMRDLLLRFKFNGIVLEVGGGMRLESHPEISVGWKRTVAEWYAHGETMDKLGEGIPLGTARRFAASLHVGVGGGAYVEKDDVRRLAEWADLYGLEIVPEVQALAHTYYIASARRDVAEDPDMAWPDSYCPSNPESYRIYFDVLDEYLDVLRPKRVHIGHDEWRAGAFCSRCRGKDTGALYAEDVLKIHRHLREKGLETWMWGDHFVDGHNRFAKQWSEGGVVRYEKPDTTSARDRIAAETSDIRILNWSGEEGDATFAKLGWPFIVGNLAGSEEKDWRGRVARHGALGRRGVVVGGVGGVRPRQAAGRGGGLQQQPPLVRARPEERGCARARGPPAPRGAGDAGAEGAALVRRRPDALRGPRHRLRLQPPAQGRRLGPPGLRPGRHHVAGLPYAIADPARWGGLSAVRVARRPGDTPTRAALPVRGRWASLVFIQSASGEGRPAIHAGDQTHFPRESSELLGFYEIRYEDELVATHEIRYGETVGRWDAGLTLPLYFARPLVAGTLPDGRPAVVWASEWANPRPDVPIASVTLVGSPGPSKARPILFGVTAVEKPRVEDLR